MGEEGRDRGGQERLPVAAADDQRALLAHADEDVGLVGGQGDEREVALELAERQADRFEQRRVPLGASGPQV